MRTNAPDFLNGAIVSMLVHRIGFPLLLLGAWLVLVQPSAGQSGTWTETGDLITARWDHTATLLPDGMVLVAGGKNNVPLASAELYDPASGTWTETGHLADARFSLTATLLPNGEVLVAGGALNSFTTLASAELYDPASGNWTETGSLANGRMTHTATLLPDGEVVVAGGLGHGILASAEIYDPASGTWTETGSLANKRCQHTATLLPNGKVLVTAGSNISGTLASAELYDPISGTWSETGSLAHARFSHTATLLPNGQVLVAGGSLLASAELYDPASGIWTETRSLIDGRDLHTATLLSNGKVLVAGGLGRRDYLASAELYDTSLGYESAWQPEITDVRLTGGKRLRLEGSLFQGISQASSGNTQDSSTNYPVVQLRSVDSGEELFLRVDPDQGWSGTSFISLPLAHSPHGPTLATVFSNGIPSAASYFVVPSRQ